MWTQMLDVVDGARDSQGMDNESTINTYVAEQLHALRKQRGLTQDAVGERLGWSKQIVSNAERADRQFTVADAFALAAAFDIDVSYFLPQMGDDAYTAGFTAGWNAAYKAAEKALAKIGGGAWTPQAQRRRP